MSGGLNGLRSSVLVLVSASYTYCISTYELMFIVPFEEELCVCEVDMTSFSWWHRFMLRERQRKGAETRKSDELKME